ncbi:MAG: aminotransferase class I/II-fold pyridoxal phosphate-dependent enzyme, partial [Sandaracinaceae bacterium]|nr:aminotransferase class I/II-fold pyridoxal phosphate-dependent enzyme [Sandaracinaceae bacterium]
TFSTYCAPRPMQLGAARALREGGAWLERARRLYRDAAMRTAEALGLEEPEGGTFVFFDVRPHLGPQVGQQVGEGQSSLAFLERALEQGVLLTPGSASGRDYEGWVRLCFTSVPPEELAQALARLRPLLGR